MPRSDNRRRIGRRTARILLALALVSILLAAAGLPVYVYPQTEAPRRADAILVLGGPGYGRYTVGFDLVTQGWAPVLVVSNPNGTSDPWLSQQCATPQTYTLYCFAPEPATTRGEAQELRRLADRFGWRTVIVVTFRPHISRARYIIQRCFEGNVIMIASNTKPSLVQWVSEYVYQTAGYLRLMFQSGC